MTYEYTCKCGATKELIRKLEDRGKPVKCVCGKLMKRKQVYKSEVIYQDGFLNW